MRINTYPKWVAGYRMKQADADREIASMRAVLATLKELANEPTQPSLLSGFQPAPLPQAFDAGVGDIPPEKLVS